MAPPIYTRHTTGTGSGTSDITASITIPDGRHVVVMLAGYYITYSTELSSITGVGIDDETYVNTIIGNIEDFGTYDWYGVHARSTRANGAAGTITLTYRESLTASYFMVLSFPNISGVYTEQQSTNGSNTTGSVSLTMASACLPNSGVIVSAEVDIAGTWTLPAGWVSLINPGSPPPNGSHGDGYYDFLIYQGDSNPPPNSFSPTTPSGAWVAMMFELADIAPGIVPKWKTEKLQAVQRALR